MIEKIAQWVGPSDMACAYWRDGKCSGSVWWVNVPSRIEPGELGDWICDWHFHYIGLDLEETQKYG